MSEKEVKKPKITEFLKCPACGSTRRLAGDAADELKKKGLMDENVVFALSQLGGPVVDGAKVLLLGSKAPITICGVDACRDCGCLYTVDQQEGEGVMMATNPQGPMPFSPRRGNGG